MIPTPETLDAQFLTHCLQSAGHNVNVVDFSSTQIGTGQIGKCFRIELQLATSDPDAPSSLVGKFPSDDPTSRGTGVALRNYYREVCFYKELAAEVSIPLPKCYFADIEGEGPDFALILEDMAPARQGDQLNGCDAQIAEIAVTQLVGLQAPCWQQERLKGFDWLMPATPDDSSATADLYRQTLPGFIDRYGSQLDADQVAIISRVAESPQCPIFMPVGEPFCLEHVDYRLDNMLINTERSPPVVTVVDWQSIKVGKPLNDVAYFLGAGLRCEVRRAEEARIVRGYHEQLVAAGIGDFDWPSCWDAYRRGTFAGFAVTVIASMIVQQTGRGDQMFLTMADRHSRHALDVGAHEFLR